MSDSLHRLEPVLTRSMGWVVLKPLKCVLRNNIQELHPHRLALPIFCQVHARDYDTKRESVTCRNLPVGRLNPERG